MSSIFGPRAALYERELPEIAGPLVVFELADIERAIPAMVEARTRYGALTIAPLIVPARSALVERYAQAVFAEHLLTEVRVVALQAYAQGTLVVGGHALRDITPYDPRDLGQLREAFILADRIVAPSRTALLAMESYSGMRVAASTLLALPVASNVPRASGSSIVVWDSVGHAGLRAWFLFALRNFKASIVIAGPGEEAKLADARVVVCVDAATPLDACRVACSGAAVVVDRLCGAHEFLAGTYAFDRANVADIARAVRAALGARAPKSGIRRVGDREPVRVRAAGERAALIVRTKERPAFLARALASVEGQQYAETRAVVINDGGPSVAALVAQFPHATLIERATSDVRSAANEALAATSDCTYVGMLDDDDALAPDHVNRLVAALGRSGCDLAVSGGVHVEVASPDDRRILSFATHLSLSHERSALLVCNLVPGALRYFARREAVERVQGFNTDLWVAEDYELWLRLSASSDVVRVTTATALYTVFTNGANRSHARGTRQSDDFRVIYALHPVTGRPLLARARENTFAIVTRDHGLRFQQPVRMLAEPIELFS